MLKWIVLYNSSFSNNHKKLFNELVSCSKKGMLELIKQCDWVKKPGNVELLIRCSDVKDILTPKTLSEFTTEAQIIDKIKKNPKKTLRSVISLWYYDVWNEFTRVDCGEVELKYLLDSERRMPRWTRNEEYWLKN